MQALWQRSRCIAPSVVVCAAILGLVACDEEVSIPPMQDAPEAARRADVQAVARARLRPDGGPSFLTGCVPEGAVPPALAAGAPFESCFRALRPGTGVHPRGMPPAATAHFDAVATVERRRSGEVIACCYTWPIRPPGSPSYQRPSPTVPPPAGVGTAQPALVRAPPPRPPSQRPLPAGMHDRPVVPALLRTKNSLPRAPLRRANQPAIRPNGGGNAPSTRGTPGTRSRR